MQRNIEINRFRYHQLVELYEFMNPLEKEQIRNIFLFLREKNEYRAEFNSHQHDKHGGYLWEDIVNLTYFGAILPIGVDRYVLNPLWVEVLGEKIENTII